MVNQDTIGTPQAGKALTVAYTATAGTTTALVASSVVRVMTTTDAFIEIGLNPTAAVNTGTYLPAYSPEYFQCPPGSKVSAVQVANGGTLYITPF